jgi:NADPH-dependent 2,4-dienoyl-CoA reductase/sulfur reductase-like enzyme
LIIATGSRSKIPQEVGSLKNIFALRTFDDAKKITLSIKTGMRAIVVGAGLAALSISEALRKNKVKVTMIVRSRLLRSLLEPDLSYYLEKRVRMAGIDVLKGVEVEKFGGKHKIQYAVASGKKIKASLAIIATGVIPNVELAQEAGIRTDKNGIIVDKRACTSDPEIYAAGDCAGTLDFISKQNIYAPVGSIAAQEAKIAGQNVAGNEVFSEGYLRAQYEKVFNMNILSMGHTLERAKRLGIEGDAVKLSPQLKKEDLGMVLTIIVKDQSENIIGIQELSPLQKLVNSFPLYQGLVGKISINELQTGWQDSILAMNETITRKFK